MGAEASSAPTQPVVRPRLRSLLRFPAVRQTLFALMILSALATPRAAEKLAVGIVPFDVATVGGASVGSGEALAKLVRIEMVKTAKLQPTVLPASHSNAEAAKAGLAANSDIVVVGTVTGADASSSNRGLETGSMLGGSLGVGGRLRRQSTTVSLHIELVKPQTGEIVDTFEVEAKKSGTSVGADFSTALGSVDNESALDSSITGKALREAAQKVAAEVIKRAGKLTK